MLRLRRCNGDLARALDNIGKVDALGLQGSTVSDQWLEEPGSPDVNILLLDLTDVTPKGCAALRKWRHLEIVKIQDNPHITVKDIEAACISA